MKKVFGVALLGCGLIGTAVAEELLSGRYKNLNLKKVLVKDINKTRSISTELLSTKIEDIVDNPEVDLVIELMGVEEPARDYVLKAIKNKKHLVTANKELIAKHGPAIFEAANENGVQVRLDATVGGGIPIINTLLDSLRANRLQSVVGILNGTTNYILTEMKKGKEFAQALSEAQAKGYAEPDPTNDVEGIDAKYKISILASLAFHRYISPEEITCQGITSVSSADFLFAKELGFSIKLLGSAKRLEDGKISVSVSPFLIPLTQPLAQIDGVLNAIQVRGDLIRELLLVGPGAGPKPTSSAILGDVLSIVKQNLSESPLPYDSKRNVEMANGSSRFYLRLRVKDQVGVIKELGEVLAQNEISLESIAQKAHVKESSLEEDGEATLVLLTHEVSEEKMEKALASMRKLGKVSVICCSLKVFE